MVSQLRSLNTIYNILQVTNLTFLTDDTIRCCTKIMFLIDNFHFRSKAQLKSCTLRAPSLFHLTSSSHTKSNLYLTNFLVTVVNDPGLERLITFCAPHLRHISSVYVIPNIHSKSEVLWNVSEYGTFYGEDFVVV